MKTCYFCHKPMMAGYYDTAFLRWDVQRISYDPALPEVDVIKEKAHLACLERAQGIFAKAQSAGGGA